MSLSALLKDESITAAVISDHLNGLSDHDQVREVRSLSIKQVHRCWAVFEPGETIDLDYLVPEHLGASVPVHHLGVNTLPMGRFFEKRFVRSPDNPSELWGYNHQSLAWLTGPGSFVVPYLSIIDPSRVAILRVGRRPNRMIEALLSWSMGVCRTLCAECPIECLWVEPLFEAKTLAHLLCWSASTKSQGAGRVE